MAIVLDEDTVKALTAPPKGNVIHYDERAKGFGCRVTSTGAKSFVLNYRTRDGRERRFTIGPYPGWKVAAARKEAETLKARVRSGFDPLDEIAQERQARRDEQADATVDVLCDRFEELHLPRLRGASVRDYKSIIRLYIRPDLGKLKVREVSHAHAAALHRRVTKRAATRANRVAAVGSKLFSFATRTPAVDPKPGEQGNAAVMRPDGLNPFKGIDRNPEAKRDRYLTEAERGALIAALGTIDDKQAADIIRLLVLTGARKGELMAARWSDFDLVAKTWTKPGATTKQKTLHHVPLSPPAAQLLTQIRDAATVAAKAKGQELPNDGYVFPGRKKDQPHRVEIKRGWRDVCIAAKMVRAVTVEGEDGEPIKVLQPTARVHDLRHTYASMLASSGLSLPIIGALLGHTQPSTTQRYSHLLTDTLRQATDVVGAMVMPEPEPA